MSQEKILGSNAEETLPTSFDIDQLVRDLCELLRAKRMTVGFAESCTGGALSAAVTSLPGVSDVYMGSVVSYSNEVKVRILGVHRDTLQDEGAVSEKVALEMAQGLRRQLKVDWSVAITGIAGPSGGTPLKPVGTVCIAIVGPNFESSCKNYFRGQMAEEVGGGIVASAINGAEVESRAGSYKGRSLIQRSSVARALRWLAEILRTLE